MDTKQESAKFLRDIAAHPHTFAGVPWCDMGPNEAVKIADEIDRLRAENERLTHVGEFNAATLRGIETHLDDAGTFTGDGYVARVGVVIAQRNAAESDRDAARAEVEMVKAELAALRETVCGECEGSKRLKCAACDPVCRASSPPDDCPPCPACGGKGTQEVKP